jgi:cell division transport system permease protein
MRPSFVMSGVATGIRRNLSMTIALILNTAIALSFAGGALLVSRFITNFQDLYEDKLNVSVYTCGAGPYLSGSQCTAEATPAQIADLQARFAADTRISEVRFLDVDAAYEAARKALPPAEAESLEPGVIPPYFVLKLNDIKNDYSGIEEDYGSAPGVDLVQNQSDSLKALLDLFDKARIGAGLAAIVIMVCAMILMANAIQVAANQRRAETGIMRLVGASRWMTQLPFMIEAVLAALVGALISLALLFGAKAYLLGNVFEAQVQNNVLPDLSTNDVLVCGGIVAIGGIVLSALTAYATLRALVRL